MCTYRAKGLLRVYGAKVYHHDPNPNHPLPPLLLEQRMAYLRVVAYGAEEFSVETYATPIAVGGLTCSDSA